MRRPRRGWRLPFVLAAALVASACVLIQTADADPATSFVTRDGTRLMLDGKPFRFTGLNIYNANSDGWCGAQMNTGSALDDALTAIGPGKEVFRSWFFQPLAINKATGLRDWSAFDHTLQAAAAHGMKVVATLTDQWGECGTNVSGNGYKTADWYVSGYTQTQPGMLESYRDWVAEVVARYKDDPRIAFWQLINEAEVTPCPPGDLQPYQTLHDWAADVSGLVKSIDPNHLVSLGTIGSGQCGADGPRYQDLHAIPTIDLCEYHDYGSPSVGIPGDQFNGLQHRIDQCRTLDKPIFVGEAGIIPNDVGGTYQARADAFRTKILAQFGAGVSGFLAWAWSPQTVPASTLDNYDIGPGDPALNALTDPPIVVEIATGGQDTCALTVEGAVWCWGANENGELGDGTGVGSPTPVKVAGLSSGVRMIATGANHACAVTAQGGVKCWGYNAFGQLGDGTHTTRLAPIDVSGLSTGVVSIAAGSYHTCALLTNGSVDCWGAANRGQLGYGAPNPPWQSAIETPTPVVGLSSTATALTAGGNHTCALIDAGGAECWGANFFGELGDGTTTDRNVATAVLGLPNALDTISAGDEHTCAIASGALKCWGRNANGQLGDGTTTGSLSPVDVLSLGTGTTRVGTGTGHTCAVTDSGRAECWGRAESGQLGDGTTTEHHQPEGVLGLDSGVTDIDAGTYHTCAVVHTGSVKCWGLNNSGDLGDGTTVERDSPVDVIWPPSGSIPAAPAKPTATAGNHQATVTWSPPSDGGSTITKYIVTTTPADAPPLDVPAPGTTAVISGLTNGTSYTFTVAAENAIGTGPPSVPSDPVIPDALPDDVTGLAQYEADGTTPIAAGATTDGTSVVLKGTVTDPDQGQLRLQVEVKPIGTPFDGTGLIAGTPVPSGSVSAATVGGLTRATGYHWRARGLDPLGAVSQSWVSFGGNLETATDYFVEAPIVFSSGNGGAQDVWIMNPNGTGLTKLTTNAGFDGDPVLSPDGTKIAYASSPTTGGSNRDIWVMNVNGSSKTQLTTNPGMDENPTWSGDGGRIAFTSIRTQFSKFADIWSMKADGTDPRRLTTSNAPDTIPTWSRDGSRIAFVSSRDGNEEIFVMNPDGTAQSQLTSSKNNVRNTTPTWSQDGARIAFASDRASNNFEIYSVLVANPAAVTRLTIRSQSDLAPAWSRDGKRILFTSGNPNGTGYDIWRMAADGSNQVRLTTTAANDNAPNW